MVIEGCVEDREHAGEPVAVRHSEASPGLGGLPLVYCVQLSLTQLLAFELDIGILRCPEILHPCRRREGRERGTSTRSSNRPLASIRPPLAAMSNSPSTEQKHSHPPVPPPS